MTTAIICPKYSINTALLTKLVKTTAGRVLKIIGSGKKAELSRYSKIILVYQYSPSPVSKEFVEFLDSNSGLEDATVMIDIPKFYVDGEADWANKTKEVMSFLSSRCEKREGEATVVDVEFMKEDDQRRYAEKLGIGFLKALNETVLSKHPVIVVFNSKTEFYSGISKRKANWYMAAGIAIVLLVALLLFIAVTQNKFRLGRLLSASLLGAYLFYVGYNSKRFVCWNGESNKQTLDLNRPQWNLYRDPAANRMHILANVVGILQLVAAAAIAVVYFSYIGGEAREVLFFMVPLAVVPFVTMISGMQKARRFQKFSDSGDIERMRETEDQAKKQLYLLTLLCFILAAIILAI